MIILTPGKKLAESWLQEIFNVERQLKIGQQNINVQCTEDYYTKKFKQYQKKYNNITAKNKILKFIKTIYDLKG